MKNFSASVLFARTIDSRMKLACVLVLVVTIFEASAQSIGTGLGMNGYNNLYEGYENGMPGVQAQILDASQIRLSEFVVPSVAQQTCDCVKTIVRPQICKDTFTLSPVQRLIQTIPFTEARSVEIPRLQSSFSNRIPSRIFTEAIPSSILRASGQVFFRNGPATVARPIGGSFPMILNKDFLGNSAGVITEINGSSFPGNVARGVSGNNNILLAGPTVVERGILNRELSNGC